MSKIEWTDKTWNPVTGCTKVSTGCKNCYAEAMSNRLHHMGHPKYANGFNVSLHPEVLRYPLLWKKGCMVFVNSMSDLFHEDVPLSFIQSVFSVMADASQHTFQVLTKRASRLDFLHPWLPWPKNVWVGVSIENSSVLSRINFLKRVPAAIRFLSLEPLLGEIRDIPLDRIHWVITGGESGPKARPIQEEWVIDIRDQCIRSKTAFFFKQWGGTNKKKSGRELVGRTWDEMPSILQ